MVRGQRVEDDLLVAVDFRTLDGSVSTGQLVSLALKLLAPASVVVAATTRAAVRSLVRFRRGGGGRSPLEVLVEESFGREAAAEASLGPAHGAGDPERPDADVADDVPVGGALVDGSRTRHAQTNRTLQDLDHCRSSHPVEAGLVRCLIHCRILNTLILLSRGHV